MSDAVTERGKRGRQRWAIGIIVLVALCIRLYLVMGPLSWQPWTVDETAGHYIMRGMRLSGDPGPMYDRVARNLLSGQGLVNEPGSKFPTRAPLYPLILAGAYSLFEAPLLPVGILHALFGAVTCFVVYQAVRMMSGGGVALVAAGVAAVMPEFLKYTPRMYASSLLVLLSAAFVLAAFASRRRNSAWWSILPGVLLGLIALTRLELLALLPAALLWQLIDTDLSVKQRLARAALLSLGLAIVVSPWLVYNQTSSVDELAEAGGGKLGTWLWGQMGPYSQTCWEDPPFGPKGIGRGLGAAEKRAARERIIAELGTSDAGVLDRYYRRAAIDFIVHHPVRVMTLMLSKLMMMWNLWPTPPPPLPAFFAYWVFLIIGVVGAVVTWREPETKLLVLIVIAVTLVYSFLHGHPRYRLPATIPIIMMFALGATHLWNALRQPRKLETEVDPLGNGEGQPPAEGGANNDAQGTGGSLIA